MASRCRGEEAACGYESSAHSDHVSVCGDEVSPYVMGFLPAFELVVMSFIPAAVRFSGDNEVSACRMRFLPHHAGKANTLCVCTCEIISKI